MFINLQQKVIFSKRSGAGGLKRFLYSLWSFIRMAKESLDGACMAVKAALSLLLMRTPNQLYTHQSRPRIRHDLGRRNYHCWRWYWWWLWSWSW